MKFQPIKAISLAIMLAFGVPLAAHAQAGGAAPSQGGDGQSVDGVACPDSGFLGDGFFSNVCWSCIFPIRVAGIAIGQQSGAASFPSSDATGGLQMPDIFGEGNSKRVPDDAADAVCACPGKTFGIPSPGITWGWWEPAQFIEIVRKPYCSPVLQGKELMDDSGPIGGDGPDETDGAPKGGDEADTSFLKSIRLGGPNHATSATSEANTQAFYHYHWIKSPYGYVSDWIQSGMCNGNSGGDFDYLWFSEIDPVWTNSRLALLTHPESTLFANPAAIVACMGDAVLSTVSKPSDLLFWCAGTWGTIYPQVGQLDYSVSAPRESSLLATRMLAQMHRRGMLQKSFGNKSVCSSRYNAMLPKQGYRLQMFYPLRETKNNHWLGASTFRWGEWRNIPGFGEDFVYLNWAWQDCCMTFY